MSGDVETLPHADPRGLTSGRNTSSPSLPSFLSVAINCRSRWATHSFFSIYSSSSASPVNLLSLTWLLAFLEPLCVCKDPGGGWDALTSPPFPFLMLTRAQLKHWAPSTGKSVPVIARPHPCLLQEHGAAEYQILHMQGCAPLPLELEQAHYHPLHPSCIRGAHSWWEGESFTCYTEKYVKSIFSPNYYSLLFPAPAPPWIHCHDILLYHLM